MDTYNKTHIINKYMERDKSLDLNYSKNTFERAITKLGYNPKKFNEFLMNSYKFYLNEIINKEYENGFKNRIRCISFDEFELKNQHKINKKNQRYEELNKHKDDIKMFYETLTIDELNYLGY